MPNHLAFENSPYLLQHADNPVDWYPWGSEALEKARNEDKPIFLSIGYAACHWCHVMAHESFEDPATAALMNEHFINIKVDREERPDLDSIYMQAVVAMTGQGGWPMSVFITPEGQPFFGGTYFPPRQRFNLPSFRDVLLSVARVWQEDRAKVLASSQNITHHMQSGMIRNEESNPLAEETLTQAAMALAQGYDWAGGGWGKAPKFPQPMAIEFLLRLAARGDKFALEIATHALDSMCTGGLYDVLGGGFARYSTDNTWLVPHFEKMLYDNAQLALVYLHAFLLTGNPKYRAICEETLEFITREMTHSEGGFYSSLDADSEGEEGKFYVWTPQQIRAAIGNPSDADFVLAAYGVTKSGNFDGSNVLQRVLDDEALAGKFGLAVAEIPRKLAALHRLLLAERDKRIRPMTDDKILVFWNSLALSAFAEAGRYLGIQRYTDVAGRNARFLLDHLYQSDRLLRSWRDTGINQIGQARHNANLEDYAGLVLALLALYQTDPNPQWYQSAIKLAEEMIDHFSDPDGGFFDTRDDHEALILRPKDLQDNATPCGNALAATCLLQLAALENNLNWRKQAEDMLVTMQPSLARYPTAFSQWLNALDYALAPVQEVAIIGNPHSPDTQQLVAAIWSRYRPYLVYAQAEVPPPPGSPALLSDRPMVNDRPTAYVCQNFTCTLPVNSPAELVKQLH